jgi:hypothetical protein
MGEMLVFSFGDISEVAGINKTLVQNGIDVYLLQPKESDLEQLFINLITDPS